MADKSSKKVFDVAKPGSAKPDATSRPLIINHRNMVQDPMVADKTATAPELESSKLDKTAEKVKPIKNVGITIQPPEALQKTAESELKSADAVAKDDGKSPADSERPVSAEQSQPNEPALSDEETQSAPPAPESEEITEAPAEPSDQPEDSTNQKGAKQDAAKAAEQTLAEDAQLQQLIESKQYYVPIGEAKRKRRTGVVVLVMLVLMAAGFVAAVDAEFIDVPIALPFDLIKM